MTSLRTARLELDPVTSRNAHVLWRLMQNGNLREFQDVPRHSREEFARRVALRPKTFDARNVGRYEWIIVVAATATPIGWVSLRTGEGGRGTVEIGYTILSGHRGLGFAREAALAVVTYAFDHPSVRQIDACCVPANTPSRRLLRSLGFIEMRIQKNGAVIKGRPVDIVIFELPRAVWERGDARAATASLRTRS